MVLKFKIVRIIWNSSLNVLEQTTLEEIQNLKDWKESLLKETKQNFMEIWGFTSRQSEKNVFQIVAFNCSSLFSTIIYLKKYILWFKNPLRQQKHFVQAF